MSSKKERERNNFLMAFQLCYARNDFSQTELAAKTGILQGRISQILAGKYTAGPKVQVKNSKCFRI